MRLIKRDEYFIYFWLEHIFRYTESGIGKGHLGEWKEILSEVHPSKWQAARSQI